jgi:hypothetical protein
MKEYNPANFALAEVDVLEFRLMLREAHEAFIEFMLPDEIEVNEGVEDFHLLVFSRFVDMLHPRDVAALPRDHAKTTYLRLAFVYMIIFSPLRFFVYMSATHGAASASLAVIWNYLNEENFIEIFGAPVPIINRPSEGHLEFYIEWIDEKGVPKRKLVILKALGAQQALRGMNLHNLRPQYVGCDDIEDETAVKTQEGYLKFLAWFDNTFMRAVSREPGRNKVSQIGNLIGLQTLLNDNINDPDWRAMRLGVVRRSGRPLWEKRFPMAAIRKELEAAKRRKQLSAWFGEMMNMPLNVENSLIAFEDIRWTPRRHPNDGHKYASFITVDPAISEKETADEAAVVLHTVDEAGVPQITEYVHYIGMTPDKMASEIRELCQKWDCYTVGVESVQLQRVLLYYFELEFATHGLHGYDFVPIDVGRSFKTARLVTFAASLRTGEYTLFENDWDFSTQLLQFDRRKTNNTDDLIDAGSMGPYMLDNYPQLIYKNRARRVSGSKSAAVGSTTSM